MEHLQIFYRRNLPHYYPKGRKFFVTFRLADTIPQIKLDEWKQWYDEEAGKIRHNTLLNNEEKDLQTDILQKKHYALYDGYLDNNQNIQYLSNPAVADIVKNAILYYENQYYQTLSFCIMPNHVHWVFDTAIQMNNTIKEYKNLNYFVPSIKGFTAKECNKVLGRTGAFWQKESYDRVIRNAQEEENILRYVWTNPTKAGLVSKNEEWTYNFML
ncbi:MAG: hypothetical protein EAZ95_09705 [Bacteroidetes bacterium]|nr:MAG: hypothetical protein EAZ95_09705 [Bacteroidota bacterium]